MRHKNCGGEIREDWTKVYVYADDDGNQCQVPGFVCQKCGKEILGDPEVEVVGEDGKVVE